MAPTKDGLKMMPRKPSSSFTAWKTCWLASKRFAQPQAIRASAKTATSLIWLFSRRPAPASKSSCRSSKGLRSLLMSKCFPMTRKRKSRWVKASIVLRQTHLSWPSASQWATPPSWADKPATNSPRYFAQTAKLVCPWQTNPAKSANKCQS